MGSPNEPPRKVDLKKWDATWERIRAKQAADKLAAGVDIQPEELSPEHIINLHDAEAEAAAPQVPEHLPPLPPGTRYGGVLDDYESGSLVRGHVFVQGEDRDWTSCFTWAGTKGYPPMREGVPDLAWHVAIPVNEQP